MIWVINRKTLNLVKALKASCVQLFLDEWLPEVFLPAVPPKRSAIHPLKFLWVGRVLPRKGLNRIMSALQ